MEPRAALRPTSKTWNTKLNQATRSRVPSKNVTMLAQGLYMMDTNRPVLPTFWSASKAMPPTIRSSALLKGFELRPSKLNFWVPFVRYHKGVAISQNFSLAMRRQPQFALVEVLQGLISIPTYLDLFFASDAPVGPGVLSYFLSQSSSMNRASLFGCS